MSSLPSSTTSKNYVTNGDGKEQKQKHTVQLAIYDLSRGMAKSLSGQLLGGPDHTIDAIPHTGVLVYGNEYFFGSGGTGITAEKPEQFRTSRKLQPMEIMDVGTTQVSQTGFELWCQEQQQFHSAKYNLFTNNCNHFSQHALREGLKLSPSNNGGSGIPQWILDVPKKFLASPMGQLLAGPILENMQVTAESSSSNSIDGGDGDGVPFVASTTTSTNTTKKKTEKLHPRQLLTPSPTPSNFSSSTATTASTNCTTETNESYDTTCDVTQPPPCKVQKVVAEGNYNHQGTSSTNDDVTMQTFAALQNILAAAAVVNNNNNNNSQSSSSGVTTSQC